jgi:hypothetical protein
VQLEHAWQRLRGSLPALAPAAPASKRRGWLGWLAVPALALACLAGVVVRVHPPARPGAVAHLRRGPLTAQPSDPEVAAHLEDAERLLTEINHADGALDEPTRQRAERLLISNAVYVQRARSTGDVAEAAVLEELGRTLTDVEHAPATPRKSWDLRMEMNTSGLLLDIRVLEQNDSDETRDQQ